MKILLCLAIMTLSCAAGAAQAAKFEKQAIELVKKAPVSTLEEQMPRLAFADWFKKTVGDHAGIVWQLSECDQGAGLREPDADLPACVEANALLPDGRKVLVLVAVGTFKKGITGAPGFYYSVIEQRGQLYSLNHLRDLPESLGSPDALRQNSETRIILTEAMTKAPSIPGPAAIPAEVIPAEPMVIYVTRREVRRVSEGALLGSAINKVSPVLSPAAKRVNAWGEVQVLLRISENGAVTDARAISGHLLLRDSAVKAARKWVFTPGMLNGVPVASEGIITFVFERP